MNDPELLQKFSRTVPVPNGLALDVCTIHWPHPHEPTTEWRTVETLPQNADEETIAAAQQRLLHNPKFFRICEECQTRKPVGWMHNQNICQGCASANHGAVY